MRPGTLELMPAHAQSGLVSEAKSYPQWSIYRSTTFTIGKSHQWIEVKTGQKMATEGASVVHAKESWCLIPDAVSTHIIYKELL